LDGEPLRALDWEFQPDGAILAVTKDGMLTRVGADGITVPLGGVDSLGKISADGQRVVVSENGDVALLDLVSGSRTPFRLGGLGSRIPIFDTAELIGDDAVVLVAITPDQSGVRSELLVAGDGDARVVYATTGGSIAAFSVSPNGQYAAISLVPDVSAADTDGYGAEAMATTVQTVFVDLETGAEVATMSGFGLQW
jgi:hypothetical protein